MPPDNWGAARNYLARDPSITPSQGRFLFALCTYADADGKCWPSLDTLAAVTGLGRSTCVAVIAALEARGAISVNRTAGKSTHYTIAPAKPTTYADKPKIRRVGNNRTSAESEPVQNLNPSSVWTRPESEPIPVQNLNYTSAESEPEHTSDHTIRTYQPKATPSSLIVPTSDPRTPTANDHVAQTPQGTDATRHGCNTDNGNGQSPSPPAKPEPTASEAQPCTLPPSSAAPPSQPELALVAPARKVDPKAEAAMQRRLMAQAVLDAWNWTVKECGPRWARCAKLDRTNTGVMLAAAQRTTATDPAEVRAIWQEALDWAAGHPAYNGHRFTDRPPWIAMQWLSRNRLDAFMADWRSHIDSLPPDPPTPDELAQAKAEKDAAAAALAEKAHAEVLQRLQAKRDADPWLALCFANGCHMAVPKLPKFYEHNALTDDQKLALIEMFRDHKRTAQTPQDVDDYMQERDIDWTTIAASSAQEYAP